MCTIRGNVNQRGSTSFLPGVNEIGLSSSSYMAMNRQTMREGITVRWMVWISHVNLLNRHWYNTLDSSWRPKTTNDYLLLWLSLASLNR
jgi:hypothetical protein